MTWLKEKVLWIAGAFTALVFFYILGRKDGKNAERGKRVLETLDGVKSKNRISARIDSVPVDKLRYRD